MPEEKAKTGDADLTGKWQEVFKLTGATMPRVEQFWQAQYSMLHEAETFAREWFERRHEATQKAVEAAHQMNSTDGTDPMAAMRAIADWQRGSFERLNADLEDWFRLCAHFPRFVTGTQDGDTPPDTKDGKATNARDRPAAASRSAEVTPV